MHRPRCRQSVKACGPRRPTGLPVSFLRAQQQPLNDLSRRMIPFRTQITTSSISLLRLERRMRLQLPRLASEPTKPVRSAALTRPRRHLRLWPSEDLRRRQRRPSWGPDSNRRQTLRPAMPLRGSQEPRHCKAYRLKMPRHNREQTSMAAHSDSRDIGRGRLLSSPVRSRTVLRLCTRARCPLAPNNIRHLRQRNHRPKEISHHSPLRLLRMH